MDTIKNKYLKYKFKYMNLKNDVLIGGGDTHNMKLKEPYFTQVSNGIKTIEGRINDEKRQKIKVGDTIAFTSEETGEIVYKSVSSLKSFNKEKTFSDVITEYNYKLLIPDAENVEEAVKVYTDIPSYVDNASKYGILFICLINTPPMM
jgi:ASC-1-like (ASCH) protein